MQVKRGSEKFDYALTLTDNTLADNKVIVFFEVKYKEYGFHVKTKNFKRDFLPAFKSNFANDLFESANIIKYNQLLRQAMHLAQPNNHDLLIMIFPHLNYQLFTDAQRFVQKITNPDLKKRIHVVYIEDIVNKIIAHSATNGWPGAREHYEKFKGSSTFLVGIMTRSFLFYG